MRLPGVRCGLAPSADGAPSGHRRWRRPIGYQNDLLLISKKAADCYGRTLPLLGAKRLEDAPGV